MQSFSRDGYDRWTELGQALALATDALYEMPAGLAFSAAEDPLQLDLPPLGGTGSEYSLSAPALRLMAALYMDAELEQAGIIPVAEMLSQARDNLRLPDQAGMALLEDFALRSQHWYDRPRRDQLFVRLFGIGQGTGGGSEATANHDFLRRLAALCAAIAAYGSAAAPGRTPDYMTDAAVRYAGADLLANLGPRQFGNTLIAGQTIQDQLQAAIAVLSNRSIAASIGGQGFWDTLRIVLGSQGPDLGRLTARAQNGIRVLNWLASVIPQLDPGTANTQPLLPPGSPVIGWANAWLVATGLDAEGGTAGARAGAAGSNRPAADGLRRTLVLVRDEGQR
jgi:hypothetical protein